MVFKFKETVATAVAAVIAAGVFALSEEMRRGIRSGIGLCAETVIPSLFLFTAVALFLSYSGAAKLIGRSVSPVTRRVFGIDGAAATAFILSMISGYPVGARIINTLYNNGELDRSRAVKMLSCSVNAGPAFITVAVGIGVLNSSSDGWRLFSAHVAASCLIAAAVRFIPDNRFAKGISQSRPSSFKLKQELPLSDALVLSVNDAAKTMFSVSAFVVLFSGIGEMLAPLPFGDTVRRLLEVTVGIRGCTRSQLPMAAFLLGFGGISVIFQVMSAAGGIRPPLLFVVITRLIHGAVSAGIVLLLEVISPRSLSTGAFNITESVAVHTSPFAAAALVLMCVVLLCFTHGVLKSRADA